jgi:hypothetical protein
MASHQLTASRTSGPMSDTSRKMIIGSMAAAALVAVAAITDLITDMPFSWGSGKTLIMDILFLVSAGIVLYLGWDAYKDLR